MLLLISVVLLTGVVLLLVHPGLRAVDYLLAVGLLACVSNIGFTIFRNPGPPWKIKV